MTTSLRSASDVIESGLALSRTAGCVIVVEELSEAEVRFANNRTTTNGVRRGRRVTVIAVADVAGGQAAGIASRSGDVALEELVRQAEALASASEPALDAHALCHAVVDSDFGTSLSETSLDVVAGVLGDLGGAFGRAERNNVRLAGFATHRLLTTYLGSSTGLRRRFVQPTGSVEFSGRSADGSRSTWLGVGTTDFTDVNLEPLEAEVSRRLGWATTSIAIPAGHYDVVLSPSAMADLMAYIYWARSGQDAEDGTTVFSSPAGPRLGAALSSLDFSLYSDPAAPGMTSMPFVSATQSSSSSSVFDNGRPIVRTDWIQHGKLNALQYHEAGAARSGVVPSHGADNLTLSMPGAHGTLDNLVARTERGLLVACLWYIREVDPTSLLLTGLTRDGVYLIEDGVIQGQVNNFRFNESPVDLLSRIRDVGTPERTIGREVADYLNRTVMPPVKVEGFNMSSVSQAM